MTMRILMVLMLFRLMPLLASELQNYISQVQNDSLLEHAQLGIYISYVHKDEPILTVNGNKSLAPASGLKLFTTAAALHHLGPGFRFETNIYMDGAVKDSILEGNLYIVGGGDPTLGSDMVEGSLPLDSLMLQWKNAVLKLGITKINGDILADNSLFDEHAVPDYWPWIDMGNYYAAGTNALTIHDNLYYLYFQPGSRVGFPAKVVYTKPHFEGLTFENHMKTGRAGSGDNGYIYAAPNQYQALLRGTIPAGVKKFSIKGAIPDPALFCAQYVRNFLISEGIEISGTAELRKLPKASLELVHSTRSPELKRIVFMINKRSVNLYTEQLLYHLALAAKTEASTGEGIKVLIEFLEENKIPVAGIKLFDGSGLSRTNRITALSMVELLKFAYHQPWFPSFFNSLAVTGNASDIGFFKRFGRNTILEDNARVKSGLVNGVRSLSGYVKGASGNWMAFSMIINNHDLSTRQINHRFERILIRAAKEF